MSIRPGSKQKVHSPVPIRLSPLSFANLTLVAFDDQGEACKHLPPQRTRKSAPHSLRFSPGECPGRPVAESDQTPKSLPHQDRPPVPRRKVFGDKVHLI